MGSYEQEEILKYYCAEFSSISTYPEIRSFGIPVPGKQGKHMMHDPYDLLIQSTSQNIKNDTVPKNHYDIIIIGSGIGGLSCAAILKFMRKNVLVVDGNNNPGGCMQTVTHGKWTWNLGLQYLYPLSTWLGPFYLKKLDIIPMSTDPKVEFQVAL